MGKGKGSPGPGTSRAGGGSCHGRRGVNNGEEGARRGTVTRG